MRHLEAGDGKVFYLQALFLMDKAGVCLTDSFGHAVAPVHSAVDFRRGVNGDVVFARQVTDGLYMVCVVVRHEYALYRLQW